MDWHPTEDELVLHYYGESTADDRARVTDHLRVCGACGDVWHDLTETLRLVSAARVPEPGEAFEATMWARISRELPALAPRKPHSSSSRPIVVFAAIAAGLAAVVTAGYVWTRSHAPAPAHASIAAAAEDSAAAVPPDPRERVLLTALNDHFSQTEMLLVELLNAPPAPAGLDFERTAADDLVASGRLYRDTARETGDEELASVLEDLEGVLVEVARSPVQVNRQDFAFLRARIEDDALLFKVRAVTTEIRDRQQTLMSQ